MSDEGKAGAVVIIRAGYATDELWRQAIAQANHYGRTGVAVDATGTSWPLDAVPWPLPEAGN